MGIFWGVWEWVLVYLLNIFYLVDMKVKDLKRLLNAVPPTGMTYQEWDDMDVLMPVSGEFDGFFHSPCIEESGLGEMGIDEDSDETAPSFMIVPCGFFEELHGVPPELN